MTTARSQRPPAAAVPIATRRLAEERGAVEATEVDIDEIEVRIAGTDAVDPVVLDAALAVKARLLARLEAQRERVEQAEAALEAAQEHDFDLRRDEVAREVEDIEQAIRAADHAAEAKIREFLAYMEGHCAAQRERAEEAARLDGEVGNVGPPGGRSQWARPELRSTADLFWHIRARAVACRMGEGRRG